MERRQPSVRQKGWSHQKLTLLNLALGLLPSGTVRKLISIVETTQSIVSCSWKPEQTHTDDRAKSWSMGMGAYCWYNLTFWYKWPILARTLEFSLIILFMNLFQRLGHVPLEQPRCHPFSIRGYCSLEGFIIQIEGIWEIRNPQQLWGWPWGAWSSEVL